VPGPVFSRGESVALRPIESSDAEFLQRLWNHPDVRPGFGLATPSGAAEVAEPTGESGDDEEYFLLTADGDPVGEAFCFDVQPRNGRAEVGYLVAPAHQGQGYATEPLELLAENAFDGRRLNRLTARVLSFNDASRRVLESVGFQREGRLREDFYVDGEYVDAELYGLLADEWRERD